MVIVPRIVAVSRFGATPCIYGATRADGSDLRADRSSSFFFRIIRRFAALRPLAGRSAAVVSCDGYDRIFDCQKRQALRKFWNSGLRVAPRVNPG